MRKQIVTRRRRYRCRDCSSTFLDAFPSIHRQHDATERLVEYIQSYALSLTGTFLLEDMENDVNQEPSAHAATSPDGKEKELTELLHQPPFSDLDERPELRHIPGIGYVSDDFPFESAQDMAASAWWSEYSHHGFMAYTRFLMLLRQYTYLSLSTKDKASLRRLREAVTIWKQDWLEGPLPDIHYTGPSESAQKVITLLNQRLFRKKHEEVFQLSDQEALTRLHPDDIQHIDSFRSGMAQRFEIVKGQLIEDLKKMGKLP